MKLEEALVELRKGRKIRLKGWADGDAIQKGECESFYLIPSDFLSDEWEVVQPLPMSFGEAMKAAVEGKRVARPKFVGWGIVADNYSLRVSRSGVLYGPSVEDILATDWGIVDDV